MMTFLIGVFCLSMFVSLWVAAACCMAAKADDRARVLELESYELTKNFEASGKPEEGKPESDCKRSMEPAGRPANPEAKVSRPQRAGTGESLTTADCGLIHRGIEPLTPTTGPLASPFPILTAKEHNAFPGGRW